MKFFIQMSTIPKSTFTFLNKVKNNNNREWFAENKSLYTTEYESVILFADSVLNEMNKHDLIETATGKKSLYRIYRDTRFSKDKTPYKTFFSGYLKRATKHLRGGYYFHIEPGNSFVGGGFWNPNSEDLLRIRKEIASDASELRAILSDQLFIDTFGELSGEKVKTAPRNFDKNHPNIDLLRYKQFLISKKFSDKDVLSPDFYKKVNTTFMAMRPFFNFMSEVLTTDENGVPLYED